MSDDHLRKDGRVRRVVEPLEGRKRNERARKVTLYNIKEKAVSLCVLACGEG